MEPEKENCDVEDDRARLSAALPLDDEKPRPSNPLRGFLSHYMDSDDDEQDRLSSPVSQAPKAKGNNSMSNEVEVFLKEIDAISLVAARPSINEATSIVCDTASSTVQSSTSEAAKLEPVVPECPWQECYDNDSGYPYYWHIDTNVVTWECPKEYQEFVDRLAAIQSAQEHNVNAPELARPSQDPTGASEALTKLKSDENTKSPGTPTDEGKIVLITSYGCGSSNEDDSSDNEDDNHDKITQEAAKVVCSSDPSFENETVFYGPRLPPQCDLENVAEDAKDFKEILPCEKIKSFDNNDDVSDSFSNSSSPIQFVPSGEAVSSCAPTSDLDEQQEPDSTTSRSKKRIFSSSPRCDSPVIVSEANEILDDGVVSNDEDNCSPEDHQLRPGFGFSHSVRLPSFQEEKDDSNHSAAGASVCFVKVDQQNAESQENEDSVPDVLDDIDLIEMELDKAFERKRKALTDNIEPHQEAPSEDRAVMSDNTKRLKLSNSFKEDNSQNSIRTTSDILLDNLYKLGANTSDLSQQQVLIIEINTRLKDWTTGALNAEYFRETLKTVEQQLRLLEHEKVHHQCDRLNQSNLLDIDKKAVIVTETMATDLTVEGKLSSSSTRFDATSSSDISTFIKDLDDAAFIQGPTEQPESPMPQRCLSPPPLPIGTPPPLPPPPDSTESDESISNSDINEIPVTSTTYEVPCSISPLPIVVVDDPPTAADSGHHQLTESSTLESEINSFYSNIAADEAEISISELAKPVPVIAHLSNSEEVTLAGIKKFQETIATSSASSMTTVKKKMKKTKMSSGLVMKKKNMPSLVEKWKRIKQEQLYEQDIINPD